MMDAVFPEPGGERMGAEALIRREHPRYGLIMPDRILPLAEEGGLRSGVTRWVD